jgi:hypothetical protein
MEQTRLMRTLKFTYINLAFSPAPDDTVSNLFKVRASSICLVQSLIMAQMFATDGHLIVNYRWVFSRSLEHVLIELLVRLRPGAEYFVTSSKDGTWFKLYHNKVSHCSITPTSILDYNEHPSPRTSSHPSLIVYVIYCGFEGNRSITAKPLD